MEKLLTRLAALCPKAQAIYEQKQRADLGDDWEAESDVWFALEYSKRQCCWKCGYRVREDEATVWALVEDGATPEQVATALSGRLK